MKNLLANKKKIIACIIVSCLIWLIKALSQDHMTTIRFPVAYQNLPNDLVMVNTPPNQLTLSIAAKGTELLRHKYKYWEEQTLVIDYTDYRGETRIRTKDLVESFSSQLKNVSISSVTPRVVQLAFEKKMSKQIPIDIPMLIQPAKDFELISINFAPKDVVISGPISIIDTMTKWKTDSLKLLDITQTTAGKLELTSTINTLHFSQQAVEYTVVVEEFTEKELLIPIVMTNLPMMPDSLSIEPLKRHAKVQFQVGINNFRKIKESSLSVIANFAAVDISNHTPVPLQLEDTLATIKNLRITPSHLEYITIENSGKVENDIK